MWQYVCKGVTEIKDNKLLDRSIQFQTNKAIERYKEFCKKDPEVVKIAPLNHIASFLSIDIATLSRLRKKNRLD